MANKILKSLPSIENCKRIFQAIATLDAIIMPEWEYRYYSFNSKWDTNEMMASMRDGSGQHYFAVFNKYGLIIKGLEHYSTNGRLFQQVEHVDLELLRSVPNEFRDFLEEPAFTIDETSFCIWNFNNEKEWHSGKEYCTDELYLLSIVIEGAEGYVKWAKDYFEINIDLDTVKDIFNLKRLNQVMINNLNSEISFEDIQDDIIEIGYPIGD